jgi:hypothetical protein
MQFKNPEILYFLALLIIPILVHLFQLQKFVKVPFTNVAFLQKIIQETRKSSQVKKWLILATRLLLFTAILFAFSQPYLSSKKENTKQQTFIYLDNSLSTNTKGEKGNLLQISAQEIIENAAQKDSYSLQTNTDFYKNLSYDDLKNKLKDIVYSNRKLSLENIFLKFKEQNNKETNTLHKNILISDFQNNNINEFTNVTGSISAIFLKPSQKDNISIDSVYTENTITNSVTINVLVTNQGSTKNAVPIAIYNNNKLVSKQTFSIKENTSKTIVFKVQNQDQFLGKIDLTLSDTFSFDNSFYFTLNNNKKINVLSIGNDADFLRKIYTKDEFNYTSFSAQNINYNTLFKQQLIILNEIENIPENLTKSLLEFSNNGVSLVIIPNAKSNLNSYKNLLKNYTNTNLSTSISDTLKITSINFNHPFFNNVFSKTVRNFQYPSVNSYYPILSQNNSSIIRFENQLPFLSKTDNNMFLFSSAISKSNSNFLNSPLVVPVFYNFGKLALQNSRLYYHLATENTIDVAVSLGKDEILSIKNESSSFIPLQKTYQNKVTLTTNEQPNKAGFYYITSKKDTLQTLAFNNIKAESSLNYLDINSLVKKNSNIDFSNSVANVFENLNKKNEVQWLWKWFLALAIVSLLLEILILKFYKP